MRQYRLTHSTQYSYGESVDLAHHLAHLIPRGHTHQTVTEASLSSVPDADLMAHFEDHFGNQATWAVCGAPHTAFEMLLTAEVTVASRPAVDPEQTPPWQDVAGLSGPWPPPAQLAEAEFCHPSPLIPLLADARALAETCFPPGRPILAGGLALTRAIFEGFTYDPAATVVSTPLGEVLANRRGVCQDFAHVQIAALRSLGLAARYVSGYLRTRPPKGQPRLRGADASHAWLSLWCGDGVGWIDLDPTNDLMVDDEHVTVAWGRDFADVSPLNGIILGGGAHGVAVAVHLEEHGVGSEAL